MKLLPLLLAVPAVLLAQSRPTPEALTAHLNKASLLHVGFTQSRTLAALSRPLKSSGSLVVSREKGVIWQVSKPLQLTIVVGPKGMLEVDASGRKKLQTSKEMPMVAQMGRIMKALLEGRWSVLDDFFSVSAEGTKDKWTIILTPKPQTAAFIKGVRVSGGAYLERIQVEEASKDRMELVFDHPREDLPLTEAEARLLSLD